MRETHLRQALEALADSNELAELGRLLRRFNLFRVLRTEHAEIRHSNMLAWLFQPRESHGLGERFLRGWLNRVLADHLPAEPAGFGLAELAFWKIRRVEVEPEWNDVDVLLHLITESHGRRIVAIENKLRARQSKGQLARYRSLVRTAFPEVPALFVFLTERNEAPAEVQYLPASHAQVHAVLADSLRESPAVDPEVAVLLRHYLAILEERNMGNPEIEKLVEAIYREHRQALDRIFEQHASPQQRLFESLRQQLGAATAAAGLTPRLCNVNIVRFLPALWNTPANLAGQAWGEEESAFVLCELPVGGRYPRFEVTVAGTDADERRPRFKEWKAELWRLCQGTTPRATGAEARWLKVYSVRCPERLNHEAMEDPDQKAAEIWRWCAKAMQDDSFGRIVAIVGKHLKQLPKG